MILSDSEIRRRMASEDEESRIVVYPEPADCDIQPASIDLRLSSDLLVFSSKFYPSKFHPIEYGKQPIMEKVSIPYILEPGEFLLGSTSEWVEVPNDLVARVEGKSSLGRIGLMVHVTAGFIDPGFRGNITLELKNLSDALIKLEEGMPICQICFEKVFGKVLRPYGSDGLGSKYQGSKGTRPANPRD